MPLIDGGSAAKSYTATYAFGTMALLAIVGTVIGTVAMVQPAATKAAWASKALWIQMGLLSGTVISGAIAYASYTPKAGASEEQERARKFRIGVIALAILTLPLLFGSLGAMGLIPSGRMLWAATVFCAAGFILPGIGFLLIQACTDSGCRD